MQNDSTIYTSKRMTRTFFGIAWAAAILAVLVLMGYLVPYEDGERMAVSTLLWAESILAVVVVYFVIGGSNSARSLSLKGSIVTATNGRFMRDDTFDLSQVVSVGAHIYRSGHILSYSPRTRGPELLLSTDDGRQHYLRLYYYKQADRDLWLPVVTELLNRPGVSLEDVYTMRIVLKAYFGDKAPAITKPTEG